MSRASCQPLKNRPSWKLTCQVSKINPSMSPRKASPSQSSEMKLRWAIHKKFSWTQDRISTPPRTSTTTSPPICSPPSTSTTMTAAPSASTTTSSKRQPSKMTRRVTRTRPLIVLRPFRWRAVRHLMVKLLILTSQVMKWSIRSNQIHHQWWRRNQISLKRVNLLSHNLPLLLLKLLMLPSPNPMPQLNLIHHQLLNPIPNPQHNPTPTPAPWTAPTWPTKPRATSWKWRRRSSLVMGKRWVSSRSMPRARS